MSATNRLMTRLARSMHSTCIYYMLALYGQKSQNEVIITFSEQYRNSGRPVKQTDHGVSQTLLGLQCSDTNGSK